MKYYHTDWALYRSMSTQHLCSSKRVRYLNSPSIISKCSSHCMLGNDDTATDHNTIVFDLNVTCTRNPAAPKGSENPDELYFNHEVLSGHLQWKPAGDQPTVFEGLPPPGPMNPNIVLAKLRPGQSVRMELHAIKGVGKDHAKFSPVGANHSFLLSHFSFN